MDFNEVAYTRPDPDAVIATAKAGAADMAQATSPEAALAVAKRMTAYFNDVDSAAIIANTRHTIDTRDAFYKQESDFWDNFEPQLDSATTDYLKAVLASPYQEALSEIYPKPFMLQAKNQLRTESPDVIGLKQQANALSSEYTNLIASAQIDFQGQTYTLAQLGPFRDDKNRAVRKAANEAYWGFFCPARGDL
ncbi:hypothetical protein [Lacticaseibacillus nasuensis]|uniref:hypothetical protein n=1 Tax=Lacticaseibacillus nasuensis TaxID=944671 RepID=UPI000A5DC0D7|nr:hypothetical protein [Lacticaseibacillus nasuensis]